MWLATLVLQDGRMVGHDVKAASEADARAVADREARRFGAKVADLGHVCECEDCA